MKTSEILRTVFYAFLSLFITFVFNYIVSQAVKPKGVSNIEKFQIDTNTMVVLDLENLTKRTHENLIFLIENTSDFKVSSDDYTDYTIEKSKTDSSQSLLIIRKILPFKRIKILLSKLNSDTKISFSNIKEKQYNSVDNLKTNQLNTLRTALFNAILYIVILSVAISSISKYYNTLTKERIDTAEKISKERVEVLDEKLKHYQEKAELTLKEQEKLNIKVDEADKLVKDYKNYLYKYGIIYSARIRDYKIELEFWKTLITKEILKDSSLKPKELFENVTKYLNTYGTKDNVDDSLDLAEYLQKISKDDVKSL